MATLEHKKYGALGSEFIVHHRTYRPRRLVASLIVASSLASAFQMYEMDVAVLWTMSVCLGVLLVYRLVNKVRKEAVLVLPSIGIQVKTQYWLGRLETHFFDKAHVRGIVINEAVTMHSVLCYLAVLLTSSASSHTQRIFPLFTRSWPGQRDLVYIYQAVENMKMGYPEKTPLPTKPLPPPPPLSPPLLPSDQDGRQERKQEATGEVVLTPTPTDSTEQGDQLQTRRRSRRKRSTLTSKS